MRCCFVIGFVHPFSNIFFLSLSASAPPILVPIEIRFHAYNSIGRSNNRNAQNPLSLFFLSTLCILERWRLRGATYQSSCRVFTKPRNEPENQGVTLATRSLQITSRRELRLNHRKFIPRGLTPFAARTCNSSRNIFSTLTAAYSIPIRIIRVIVPLR